MAVFNCKECSHTQDVDDAHIGKTTRCPKCQTAGKVIEDDLAIDLETSTAVAEMLTEVESSPRIERCSGGEMRTHLSHGIVLNKSSSHRREWVIINDPSLPISIVGRTGIKTIFMQETDYQSASYYYSTAYVVQPLENLSALEIRYLTFDVWGAHERTLVATTISDIPENIPFKNDAKWELYSENEAIEFYASIAYVARVRTSHGRVFAADTKPIIAEAQRFSEKFLESDLEPIKVKR